MHALKISSQEARQAASSAARSERGLRAAQVKKRVARHLPRALLAIGAFAIAALAWQHAPWRAAPPRPAIPVFQLDHNLKT